MKSGFLLNPPPRGRPSPENDSDAATAASSSPGLTLASTSSSTTATGASNSMTQSRHHRHHHQTWEEEYGPLRDERSRPGYGKYGARRTVTTVSSSWGGRLPFHHHHHHNDDSSLGRAPDDWQLPAMSDTASENNNNNNQATSFSAASWADPWPPGSHFFHPNPAGPTTPPPAVPTTTSSTTTTYLWGGLVYPSSTSFSSQPVVDAPSVHSVATNVSALTDHSLPHRPALFPSTTFTQQQHQQQQQQQQNQQQPTDTTSFAQNPIGSFRPPSSVYASPWITPPPPAAATATAAAAAAPAFSERPPPSAANHPFYSYGPPTAPVEPAMPAGPVRSMETHSGPFQRPSTAWTNPTPPEAAATVPPPPSTSHPPNPFANTPIYPIKTTGVPKAALHALYGQPTHRRTIISADMYHTWNHGPPHALQWSACFVCPLTAELFLSGPYPGVPSHRRPGPRPERYMEDLWWFNKKANAEHGAAARAYDCLCYREALDKVAQLEQQATPGVAVQPVPFARIGGGSGTGKDRYELDEDYSPPYALHQALWTLPDTVPEAVRFAVEQQQYKIRGPPRAVPPLSDLLVPPAAPMALDGPDDDYNMMPSGPSPPPSQTPQKRAWHGE